MPDLPIPHDNIPYTRNTGKHSTACDMSHEITPSLSTNASSSMCVDHNNNNNIITPAATREGVNVLTTSVIMKECVAQGFYRNPICNEKLYLHHKAFTDIEPCALVPYTDVKVLWLESNALRELQCGRAFVRVKPPHVPNPFDSDEESESEYMICDEEEMEECEELCESHQKQQECKLEKESNEFEVESHVHVDPTDDKSILAHTTNQRESSQDAEKEQHIMTTIQENNELRNAHVDEEKQTHLHVKKIPLVEMNTIGAREIDVFSSQYRKLRQLYLHNNVLHEFPDLHQFELLHSLNLSDNYIEKIDAHCPRFHKALQRYERRRHELEWLNMHLSKSAQREHVKDKVHTVLALESTEESIDVDMNESKELGTHNTKSNNQHEELSEKVKMYASFCTHCAVPDNNEFTNSSGGTITHMPEQSIIDRENNTNDAPRWRAKNINGPEWCFRNLCSSLHTLHIANNRVSSFDDCIGLVCFKNLQSLDISNNNIKDGEMFLVILRQLDRLKSLKCHGNPFVRTLPKYRKRILSTCVSLLYLDDRPVFDDERRLVTAWSIGGADEEEKERNKMRSEKAEIAEKRLRDFRKMLQDHRGVNEHALVQTLLRNYSSNTTNNDTNNINNYNNAQYTDSPTSSESSDDDACNGEYNHEVGVTIRQNNLINHDNNMESNNSNDQSSNICNNDNGSNIDDNEVDVNKCFIHVEEAVGTSETEIPTAHETIHNITRVLSSNGDHISHSALLRNRDASYAANSNVNDANDENDNDDDVYIPSV